MKSVTNLGEQTMKTKVIRLIQDKQIKILENALSGNEHDKTVAIGFTELLIEINKQIEQL